MSHIKETIKDNAIEIAAHGKANAAAAGASGVLAAGTWLDLLPHIAALLAAVLSFVLIVANIIAVIEKHKKRQLEYRNLELQNDILKKELEKG